MNPIKDLTMNLAKLTRLITMPGSFKLLALFMLLTSGSDVLAHAGHGGDSVTQHAFEHAYMLLPVVAVLSFALGALLNREAD